MFTEHRQVVIRLADNINICNAHPMFYSHVIEKLQSWSDVTISKSLEALRELNVTEVRIIIFLKKTFGNDIMKIIFNKLK